MDISKPIIYYFTYIFGIDAHILQKKFTVANTNRVTSSHSSQKLFFLVFHKTKLQILELSIFYVICYFLYELFDKMNDVQFELYVRCGLVIYGQYGPT